MSEPWHPHDAPHRRTPPSGVHLDDDGSALSCDLFTYVYRPADVQYESPRPYFHPIRTTGGRELSTYRPWDHVWHKGLAWSLPNVGPWNFWGGPTYVRDEGYQDLANDGTQEHERFATVWSDGGSAGFREDLAWRVPPSGWEPPGPGGSQGPGDPLQVTPGAVVVREERSVRASLRDGVWVLAWHAELTNVSDDALDLGSPTTKGRENAGYGGLFWRGPRSFTDGVVLAPGFTGDAEQVRGERFEWMGIVGRHDGAAPTPEGGAASSTLLMVDPGTNPGGKPQWFVRSQPFCCLCPAPAFGEEIPFAPGETLTFDYAVVVADGASDEPRAATLADLGRRELGITHR
ncbi:PmoA family protein [Myceligenerans crystallogenes]|uniref:PmoA family protein n=1 Tax=Myceligenerans crystallogenes TaxID=316335 RepID=A0ABP4ZF08_9MICO